MRPVGAMWAAAQCEGEQLPQSVATDPSATNGCHSITCIGPVWVFVKKMAEVTDGSDEEQIKVEL